MLPAEWNGCYICGNSNFNIPLLFDTGASITTICADYYQILGLNSWDEGERTITTGVGGEIEAYLYSFTFEISGKRITAPVQLIQMDPHPLWGGLLGREAVFREFGFGFWESTKELYITSDP